MKPCQKCCKEGALSIQHLSTKKPHNALFLKGAFVWNVMGTHCQQELLLYDGGGEEAPLASSRGSS